MSDSEPSPAISAYLPDTFAEWTIRRRLPRILSQARTSVSGAGSDVRWDELASAIQTGCRIETGYLRSTSPWMRNWIAALHDKSWNELSFFELEFLFYHAINSLAGFFESGTDVFLGQRRQALREALAGACLARLEEAASLEAALLRALLGNEADLSQLSIGGVRGGLLEGSLSVLREVSSLRPELVQILADNAGTELCADLLLADAWLEHGTKRVVLQLKPRPMFVSDALVSDADETVSALVRANGAVGEAGARLVRRRAEGRILFAQHEDFAEPRSMDQLSSNLLSELEEAPLVISKGDLNYRRFLGDRAWPPDTPVRTATLGRGISALALRVLKSDCVVGLERKTALELDDREPDWKSSGRFALVQWLGRPPS